MIARLWWKEARQAWPIWAFLAATGLAGQGLIAWYADDGSGTIAAVRTAVVFTMMYLFLIAAAVFAGERENGTLGLLDAIPVERRRVWWAKASFSLVTTAALGLLLWLSARLVGADSSQWAKEGGVAAVWGLNGLGWGLLWSTVLGNALFAALMAMASLCLCLLALVDLNHAQGPLTFESAPSLLILAGLATGASAWIFRRTGPPRPAERSRPRSKALTAAETPPAGAVEAARNPRPARIWPSTATRLAWQSLREMRANLGMLLAVGLLPWLLVFSNVGRFETDPLSILCLFATAILTGVSAFQGDNRGRTGRFLLQHGARPGLVWGVKILAWGIAAIAIWWLGSYPLWRIGVARHGLGAAFHATAALLIGFAASALCGMVFRRGIMAGAISLVACLAIYGPLAALYGSQLLEPWRLPFVAAGLLLVGWAWSGDWLFDRPGSGRWARLGLYATAVTGVLVSSYIGGRVWGVTSLPPANAEQLLQTARITASIDDAKNAAPLYREARRLLEREPMPGVTAVREPDAMDDATSRAVGDKPPPPTDPTSLVVGAWDADDPRLGVWLAAIEPGLQKIREASRLPACRFEDPTGATLFRNWEEPPWSTLLTPLVISARVKSARGDLDGAWTEIETLLRLARQLSHTPSWSDAVLEPAGLGLAMRWAADPLQTVGSLERAFQAYRAIPEPASKADRVRMAALVFRNTLDLPKDELLDGLFSRWATSRMKIDPTQRLMYDLQTTPWEIARARRVLDILAAARIREIGDRWYERNQFLLWTPQVDLVWDESDDARRSVSAEDLAQLASRTPLIQHSDLQRDLSWWDRNETARKALTLIFLLRIWQAGHDGLLPRSLWVLTQLDVEGADILNTSAFRDHYWMGEPFGFIPSEGQKLFPLGLFDPTYAVDPMTRPFESTEGCWLLYSVGPDGKDDRARKNFDRNVYQGDIIFPLKDGVKPPAAEAR